VGPEEGAVSDKRKLNALTNRSVEAPPTEIRDPMETRHDS
jgi:hypothetical protein